MQKIVQTRADASSLLECYAECSLSYAKIVQTRAESLSLLECYALAQPTLCKSNHFIFYDEEKVS
jgi:hypothetical protein